MCRFFGRVAVDVSVGVLAGRIQHRLSGFGAVEVGASAVEDLGHRLHVVNAAQFDVRQPGLVGGGANTERATSDPITTGHLGDHAIGQVGQ
ncbi:Uncharacterised protein [Mycobacteroides abscessus]|nr:Uncharacterised protein [Mycobacteroides abscessus]